ncbi:hypothetical protein GDO78_014305 [Eleutherodactylus coqui]|uniref:Olfactory receptor n=2 Tax=Eleutherodactylus coqui TaxID=57060 RepID=A0A8J6EEQ7_ELECQ|nr:hypothetical protein GDO78_014305 [Eleutherodactylus coqui]
MTAVTKFILVGFQASQNIKNLMFFLLLVVYCFTIFMNFLIITLVSTSRNLHTPMYFFLLQLSISDILLTTDIVPKMLQIMPYYSGGTISFTDCITQLYFFCASDGSECLLLTVMSYDRYVAICNPLRYTAIMTSKYCVILATISWLVGFSIMLCVILSILMLHFCGPNIINHFFCDFVPIIELSCSDTNGVQLEVSLLGSLIVIIPIIIIIFSYFKIIVTTLSIPTSIGRHKAFSTCSSHLIVVSIFYGSLFAVYVVPKRGQSSTTSKVLSLLYTVFTPLINPIIYSLKNNDIKKALHEHIYKHLRC